MDGATRDAGEDLDMPKVYEGSELAKRVFLIVMAGVGIEIALMFLIVM